MALKQHQLATWLRAQWDRALGVALVAVGIVALLIGYQGAANAAFVVEALSYLASGGLGGLVLVGGGFTLVLSADLHDEWRKLDRIEEAIRSLGARPEALGPAIDLVADNGAGNGPDATEDTADTATRRWRRRSVGAVGVLAVVCGGGLILAWDSTASAEEPGHAFESAASGSAAVLLYSLVGVALLVVQRHRNMGRRRRLLQPFAGLAADAAAGPPGGAGRRPLPEDSERFIVPGLTRHHRPGCPALAGGNARPATDAEVASRVSCGLCRP